MSTDIFDCHYLGRGVAVSIWGGEAGILLSVLKYTGHMPTTHFKEHQDLIRQREKLNKGSSLNFQELCSCPTFKTTLMTHQLQIICCDQLLDNFHIGCKVWIKFYFIFLSMGFQLFLQDLIRILSPLNCLCILCENLFQV